jgi:hypothetical protein
MSSLTIKTRNISIDSYLDTDDESICNECDIEKIMNTCDKCGNGVCKKTNCHWMFPHTFNRSMIICKGCFDEIDNKLINYDHLLVYKFIKQNVKRRQLNC